MRPRDLWTLVGTLCLLAGLGIVFLGQESMAESVHPDSDLPPVTAPVEGDARKRETPAAAEGVLTGRPDVAVAEASSAVAQREDTSGWTTGIVRGDIQVAVSVLDRIKTITIHVEEARNAVDQGGPYKRPHRFVVPVTMGRGTPTFEVTGIPFSEYPYIVTAHAPGLNGGRRTVAIDAQNPLADDLVLAITPGSPFTVLLRDQDMAPYIGLDIGLTPVGEPLGRPRQNGTSDNFGSVVFEDVLAGDYKIQVAQSGQVLIEPQVVSVQPGPRLVSSRIQSQGHTVTIPRGVALPIRIADVRGYGLADVAVSATAADKVKLTVLEAVTDLGGNVVFPHLTPGVWQIDVLKMDYQRGTRMVTIKPGEIPSPQEFQLVRLR